jgi:DNA-binding NarL/FixJ family response regulator
MGITVMIADDHALVRQSLRTYLEAAEDIQVVGEASTGREILDLISAQGPPDVAVLDVRMPEMDGLQAARRISEEFPTVAVMMLSAHDDRDFVVEAVRAGAKGYLLKTRDAGQLLEGLRLVAGGGMAIDPDVVAALAEEISRSKEPASPTVRLSARDIEVLQLIAFGHTTTEIACELGTTPATVKAHVERIFAKLRASDRTSAVAEGLRRRLID